MDGVKTYVVFGVIMVVSGNYRPIAVCIILMFLFFSPNVSTAPLIFSKLSFSYVWTAATNNCIQWRRVHPASQFCVQHQLYRQKKRCLGWAPADKHLCLPRVLHGDAFHLQRNSGKHQILHVHLWKPREWPGGRSGRRQWGGNICLCSRWICFFTWCAIYFVWKCKDWL